MTASAPRAFPALPEQISKIHIIGICGTAMGSLAVMLKSQGYDVRGSDAMAYPPMSTWLAERGVEIMQGYDEANLDWGPDLVIVGNVSRSSYGDAVAARERNIPYISLPEALRHLFMSQTRNLVITGTHGKTTTTSMLAWILTHAGLEPGFMVGGIAENFGSNHRVTGGELFVIEGDEYDTAYFDKVPKFWHYKPFRATINNIEFDHADIYPDVAAVEHVFEVFAGMLPAEGALWINGDDARVREVVGRSGATCRISTFGLGEGNDVRASAIVYGEQTRVRVVRFGEDLGEFLLPAIGEFNVRNMLGALAMAMDEGVEADVAREAIARFARVKKRQEWIGEVDGTPVIDDFAHHPSAVKATIDALKMTFPDRKLRVAFEIKSNTSRRRVFQHDFPPAFAQADSVILTRPWKKDSLPPEQLIDMEQLFADIKALVPDAHMVETVEEAVAWLGERVQRGDVVAGLSGSAFDGFHQKMLDRLAGE